MNLSHEVAKAGMMMSPGLGVSLYALLTHALPVLVGLLTVVLLVLQILQTLQTVRRLRRGRPTGSATP